MPTPRVPLGGLYVILDADAVRRRSLLDVLRAALGAGARLFQYRTKHAAMRRAYEEGIALRRATAEAGALLIVNDRCDLALALDADGVHLGQDDLPLPDARRVVGPHRLIGISTHRADQVQAATSGGADYLGFGPIHEPRSKPDHEPPVGLDGLRQVRPLTALPIFAIGGMTPETSRAALEAGADGVAVISAVLDAEDVAAAVRAFRTGR